MIQSFFRDFDPIQLLLVPAALVAIILHEMSHGLAARKLGDPTADSMGRLSVNPLRHIDWFGLLFLVVAGFGWAKPVPVDTRYFKKPKRDLALTALAGPVMNFIIAALSMLIGGFVVVWYYSSGGGTFLYVLANFFVFLWTLNISLGIFNLLPVPPLDGFKIFGAFLPDSIYFRIMPYERFGMLVLMALLFLGVLDVPLTFLRSAVLDFYVLIFGAPANALADSLFGMPVL